MAADDGSRTPAPSYPIIPYISILYRNLIDWLGVLGLSGFVWSVQDWSDLFGFCAHFWVQEIVGIRNKQQKPHRFIDEALYDLTPNTVHLTYVRRIQSQ